MFRPTLPRFRALLGAALLPIAWSACVHQASLKPDPAAQSLPGSPLTALAEVGGVRVLATGEALKAQDSQASDQLTPIEIKVENHSGRPLWISHEDFSLDGDAGASYGAIAATRENERLGKTRLSSLAPDARYQRMNVYVPVTAACDQQKLGDAPYLAYSYAGPTPSVGLQPYIPDAYGSVCQSKTPQTLADALPEGTLPDGATTSGTVYFQGLAKRESTVRLNVSLVDSSNRQPIGKVTIPLAVTR